MSPRYRLAAIIVLLAFGALIWWTFRAGAETKGEWFRSLMRPDTNTSCCSDADCRATNARFVNGHWEAEFDGTMTPIPDGKIVRNQDSYDGRAYLCATKDKPGSPFIYCFVRPGGQT